MLVDRTYQKSGMLTRKCDEPWEMGPHTQNAGRAFNKA